MLRQYLILVEIWLKMLNMEEQMLKSCPIISSLLKNYRKCLHACFYSVVWWYNYQTLTILFLPLLQRGKYHWVIIAVIVIFLLDYMIVSRFEWDISDAFPCCFTDNIERIHEMMDTGLACYGTIEVSRLTIFQASESIYIRKWALIFPIIMCGQVNEKKEIPEEFIV